MRLFGVAYVVTAALAVYRMAKDMRTYYTARRAHATTRKKAIYAFDDTYLPVDLMPCGRSIKKALTGLPKRIYM